LLPTSSITVVVMYADSKTTQPDGTMGIEKFRFAEKRLELDFLQRHNYGRWKKICQSGSLCDVTLNIEMDDSSDFKKELDSRKDVDWRTALFDPSSEYRKMVLKRQMESATRRRGEEEHTRRIDKFFAR
jgi:hypothetical protein